MFLLLHNTNLSIGSLVRCSWNSDANRYTKHCYRLVLGGPWSSCRYLVDHSMHSLHSLGQHFSTRGCGQSSMGRAGGDAPLAGWGGRNAGLCHLTGFCVQGNFCVRAVAPVPLWCQGPNKSETSFHAVRGGSILCVGGVWNSRWVVLFFRLLGSCRRKQGCFFRGDF